jgi:hypothetical protein
MFGAKMLVRMNALIPPEADVGQPRRMRPGRTQITRSAWYGRPRWRPDGGSARVAYRRFRRVG